MRTTTEASSIHITRHCYFGLANHRSECPCFRLVLCHYTTTCDFKKRFHQSELSEQTAKSVRNVVLEKLVLLPNGTGRNSCGGLGLSPQGHRSESSSLSRTSYPIRKSFFMNHNIIQGENFLHDAFSNF